MQDKENLPIKNQTESPKFQIKSEFSNHEEERLLEIKKRKDFELKFLNHLQTENPFKNILDFSIYGYLICDHSGMITDSTNYLIGNWLGKSPKYLSLISEFSVFKEVNILKTFIHRCLHTLPTSSRYTATENRKIQFPYSGNSFFEMHHLVAMNQHIFIIHDITESKILEKEIESVRTQQAVLNNLANIQLLTGGVTHEINNLLAVITLRSQHINDSIKLSPISEEVISDSAEAIERSSHRLALLIKSLGMFARDSKMDLIEKIQPMELIANAFELCRINYKHLDVEIKISKRLSIDTLFLNPPYEFSKFFLGLLSKAYEAFTDTGRGRIHLEVSQREELFCLQLIIQNVGMMDPIKDENSNYDVTTFAFKNCADSIMKFSKDVIEAINGQIRIYNLEEKICVEIDLPLIPNRTGSFDDRK